MIRQFLDRLISSIVDFFKYHRNIFIIFLSAIIGLLGGYCAIGFRYLVKIVQNLAIGSSDTEQVLSHLNSLAWGRRLIAPVIGGLLIGLIIRYLSKEAREHGVPEVIKAIILRGGRLRSGLVFIKSISSAITLGFGGSVGREGPIVHIGCTIGSAAGQLLKLSHDRIKVLVACGAAAGLAATFNAPIASVLFAIEIILGNFAINSFSPIVVSSVLATMVSRYHYGDTPAFVVPHYMFKSSWELPLYLVLGAFIAIIGLALIQFIDWSEKKLNATGLSPAIKAPLGMMLLGILIIFFPNVYGNGFETITLTLSDEFDLWLLACLIPVKIIATSITFASGGSGGIFSPALFIGAVSGATFGKLVHLFFPEVTASSSAYAMVGMGALVSAVMHAPFTAILTMFELTGDYTIIIPLMFACIVSSMLTSNFKKESIYTDKLKREGINLDQSMETTLMKRNIVRDIMHAGSQGIDPDMAFEKLFNYVSNSGENHFYIVGRDGIYLGHVSIQDIANVMKSDGLQSRRRAFDIMSRSYPRIKPDDTLWECVRAFGAHGFYEFPVVDANGKFMGVINYRDIFILYNREIMQDGSLSLKFISKSMQTVRKDYLVIPDGYRVEVVPVMGKLINRSISDLNIRKSYNINIIAIRPLHGADVEIEIPKPNRNLTRQDALIILGMDEQIEQLKRDMNIVC